MDLVAIGQLVRIILEVAFGLGFVIFVHELGHFAVAKWCGVKCEKFYLGFDIGGLKLCKFKWGETEYGVGILPLGGYVKMLGQDDNPGRAAEERERSKLKGDAAQATAPGASGEEPLDPRSYMAQSVPKRMAIISAGVIMNVIFAFIMAVIAYRIGVPNMPCGVGEVLPGEPAWQAGLQAGDEILQVNDNDTDLPLRFRDLQTAVALVNLDKGVRFKIKRPDLEDPRQATEFWLTIKPDNPAQAKNDRLTPTIGAIPPLTTTLAAKEPVLKDSPAGETGKFEGGDKIVAVGDVEVADFAELHAQLARHAEDPLMFTVERKTEATGKASAKPATKRVTIEVGPNPLRTLGLVMKIGKITAVQDKSPAADAGLKAGDTIVSIDGQPPGDPLTLPQRIRRLAGKTLAIGVSRIGTDGKEETLEKSIELRESDWPESAVLGIAYDVSKVVEAIDPDGPAANAEVTKDGKPADPPRLAAGDTVVRADFLPKDPQAPSKMEKLLAKHPFEFGDSANWAFFMDVIDQQLPPGAQVRLTLSDGRTVEILPTESKKWFTPERGFHYEPESIDVRAKDWRQATIMGWRETKESLSQVYQFLRKLFTGQVSPLGLGGPITIAGAAGSAADQGISTLLLFLTMLSANLAVINFLPIPLLDGGHMVFLALEGILRKPVKENVVLALHYAGFAFIIGLMLFVLSLDFGIVPRHSQPYQRGVRLAAAAPAEPRSTAGPTLPPAGSEAALA